MTIKFTAYGSRESVAAMLEGPVRGLLDPTVPSTWGDIHEVIAELDRIDRVNAAERRLATADSEWRRAIYVEYAKVTDAPAGTECRDKNYSGGSWNRSTTTHKAKHLLNGVGYCGTHLKRAEDSARSRALSEHRAEFVKDAADRAIMDDDRALTDQRRDNWR